ncbi:hypothetical protein Egran_01234 [Elaphomyces granulatus]|uniref:Importin N-terminal domain-containing protein n=1 Tax=Elaphomyces granulatus TaxID=519963 RepID=A0A232M3T9_9EURO|nr:hypothetical protein Egran_01234 [Elaphomyces granulatus]
MNKQYHTHVRKMQEPIELSGEANPLTLRNLFNALVSAGSSTQQQVQIGSQQLQNWEKHEQYYSLLQDIFVDYSLPLEVRYLAIIQLKNGIDKYWRKTATNAIKKHERDQIKTRALEVGVLEPSPLVALHNALMVAKISRYEFPNDWPEVIPWITSSLRSSAQPDVNPLQLPRTLLILLQVVKELSTVRINKSRTAFQSVSPEIFQLLGSIYIDMVNRWVAFLEQGHTSEEPLLATIEQSLVCLKVIRRLIISGFEHPSRAKSVQDFWELTHVHFTKFYSLVEILTASSPQVQKWVEKHLLQLSKLHVEMAKSHPASFALLPGCVILAKSYWSLVVKLGEAYEIDGLERKTPSSSSDSHEEKTLMEKLGLKALLLIRACAKMAFNPAQTFKYQQPRDKEEKKESVELIKSQLFTHDFAVNVMELLVTTFFKFRKTDFEEWEEDPEEWEKKGEEVSEAWEFSIRSCSEKLFLDLVIHFKELLVPRLLNVFYSFANPQNRDILLKDSLYSAIGLATASLEQHLDFNTFLESTLVPEVQMHEQGYNVLRRRIAILLGQWVPVKPGELNRVAIYQIFQHLLNKQDPLNDLVVRITAGRQLRNVLDPYEFSAPGFMPYATPILQNLLALIQEVKLAEIKMGLLETVRVAVVKMEDHISPFSDQIMTLLPPLWAQSGEEHLMKQAILTLLSSLIQSLKGESIRYHADILPLIQSSIDPQSETIVYLLDEALDLWSSIIAQAPAPASPELLSLLPGLFPIFEAATDSAPLALQIAESYILLAPQEVLHDRNRFQLLVSLETLLGSATRQRIGIVPHLVELLIRAVATIDGGSEASYNVLMKSLIDSSFLSSLLDGLYSAYEASQTTGPKKKSPVVYGVVETDYFSVLARLALASPRTFMTAISAASGTSEEHVIKWILSEWFFHYDNIGNVTQKKLHALALTHLLSVNGSDLSPPTYLLDHLQSYLTTWTDIVTELSEGFQDPSDPRGGDYLIFWNNAETGKSQENERPESIRRRQWENADIVHNTDIRDFVKKRLQAVIIGCGGEQRFQEEWLVNVDREVTTAFGALGIL